MSPQSEGSFCKYTADLLCMDTCSGCRTGVHPRLSLGHAPLVPTAWALALGDDPDRVFMRYLLRGMTEGSRVGFHHDAQLRSAPRNMISTRQHLEVVQAYLANECTLSRRLGPSHPLWSPSYPRSA